MTQSINIGQTVILSYYKVTQTVLGGRTVYIVQLQISYSALYAKSYETLLRL